ncbi:MAG: GAF domain-containing protein [Chloroflexi bacterium]|nr:GAF domain-containing protein [Chloroflexota bacterium]
MATVALAFVTAWIITAITGPTMSLFDEKVVITRFEMLAIVLILGLVWMLRRRWDEFRRFRSLQGVGRSSFQRGGLNDAAVTALSELEAVVFGDPDINVLGDAIAKSASRVLNFDRMSIIALDLGNGASSLMYALGGSATIWAPGERHVLPAGLMTSLHVLSADRDGTILSKMELSRIGELNPTVFEIIPTWGDLTSVMTIPLVSASDEPIALLFFHSFSDTRFEKSDLPIASAIGQLASPAVHRDFAIEGYRTSSREMAAAAEIGKLLNSDSLSDATFTQVADILQSVIPFDQVSVAIKSQSGTYSELSSLEQTHPMLIDPTTLRPEPSSFSEMVSTTGEPLLFNRWSREALYEQCPEGLQFVESRDFNGAVIVPLKLRGDTVGMIGLFTGRDDLYDEASIARLSQLADYLTALLRRAFEEVEAEVLVNRRRVLALISDLSAQTTDIEGLFSQVFQNAGEILEFDGARSAIFDRGADEIEVVFSGGTLSPDSSTIGTHPPDKNALGLVQESRKTFRLGEANRDVWRQHLSAIDGTHGVRVNSVLMTPVVWHDEVVGVIVFQSAQWDAYSQDDLGIADQIASRVSASVASTRLRRIVERDSRTIDVLGEINRIATSSLNFETKLQRIKASANALFPLEELAVRSYESEHGSIDRTFTTSDAGVTRRVEMLLQLAKDHNGPLNISRAEYPVSAMSTGRGGEGTEAEPVSVLVYPMNWHAERVGFVALISSKLAKFTKGQEKVAHQIVSSLAAAIANERLSGRTSELSRERAQSQKLVREKERLEQMDMERERFISSVSHELKTPLTAITAFSEILARNRAGSLGEREIQHVALIQKNARMLNHLISDLFDTTSIQSGRFELIVDEFVLGDLLKEIAQSMAPTFVDKDQNFTMTEPPELVWLKADRNRLAQVITNLLGNASKYSPDSTQIDMISKLDKGVVSFQVLDRGPGISSDERAKLFTPFYRVDNQTTRNVSGSGLGLYVSKSICDHHSGSIEVQNRPDGGSIFEVRLPNGRTEPSEEWIAAQSSIGPLSEPHSILDALPEIGHHLINS